MATALAAAHRQDIEMSLTLPPEFERAIRERLETGLYASAEDAFKACLVALEQWEAEQAQKLETLRAEVRIGVDQLQNGKVVDGHEAFARARARLLSGEDSSSASANQGVERAEFARLGAEVDAEVARIAQGMPVDLETTLDRMRTLYPGGPPPAGEFFRRMNAWRIATRIADGKYDSSGDVIHAALCSLEEAEAADAADDDLRSTIDAGLAQLDRGEGIPGDVALERIREEFRHRIAAH